MQYLALWRIIKLQKMRLEENYHFNHHFINPISCGHDVLKVSNQSTYSKNNLMKVLACMKEDEADCIKYSRIESDKNDIDIFIQPSPKSNSLSIKRHFKSVVQIRGNTKFDMY